MALRDFAAIAAFCACSDVDDDLPAPLTAGAASTATARRTTNRGRRRDVCTCASRRGGTVPQLFRREMWCWRRIVQVSRLFCGCLVDAHPNTLLASPTCDVPAPTGAPVLVPEEGPLSVGKDRRRTFLLGSA